MADSVLAFANAREEAIQEMIASYRNRLSEIIETRGQKRDPSADDVITDETVKDRLLNGIPKVPVFSLPNIEEARDMADEGSPLHGFIVADDIGYVPLTPLNAPVSYISDRFEDGEFDNRRKNMGSFSTNSSTLAVVDGTGKMFLASNTERNRTFLMNNGYCDADRNFHVPLSNAETVVGIKDNPYSYQVHRVVHGKLGTSAMSSDGFEKMLSKKLIAKQILNA